MGQGTGTHRHTCCGQGSAPPDALCLGLHRRGLAFSHVVSTGFYKVWVGRWRWFVPIANLALPSGEEAQVSGMRVLNPPALRQSGLGTWGRDIGELGKGKAGEGVPGNPGPLSGRLVPRPRAWGPWEVAGVCQRWGKNDTSDQMDPGVFLPTFPAYRTPTSLCSLSCQGPHYPVSPLRFWPWPWFLSLQPCKMGRELACV